MKQFAWLSQDVFDELYPFSFVTNTDGTITQAGKTFTKLYGVSPCGVTISDLVVESFMPGLRLGSQPQDLLGESIRVQLPGARRVMLNGMVLKVDSEVGAYLFTLQPAIKHTEEVQLYGLDLSDFGVATSIFDHLLFIHAQNQAQVRLKEANNQLKLNMRMLELLHSVILDAFQIETVHEMYTRVVARVAQQLGWDIGHVFQRSVGHGQEMISTDIWYLSDPARYTEFVQRTSEVALLDTLEFPVFSCHSRDPRWVADYRELHDGSAGRAGTIPGVCPVVGVSVPVVQAGSVVSVLEFFSEKPQPASQATINFFSLLGTQIGYALAQHESNRNQRDQWAALAHASKMATLGEMAAGVAHEINNPVSTISLVSQVMRRMGVQCSLTSESMAEQLSHVDLCVERISEIVKQLRDFSRESANDPFQAVAVQKIITDTVGLCEARFKMKGVNLSEPHVSLDGTIECRYSQISQILLNLLGNALDAVQGQSKPWVRVEFTSSDSSVEFAVCDCGPGISKELRDKIMTPFFTTKPPGEGTGLGLSISANLAASHGGTLRLDDTTPYTRFVLTLPKKQRRSVN